MNPIIAKMIPEEIMNHYNPQIVAAEKEGNNQIDILDFIGDPYWGGFSAKRMSAALRSIGEDNDVVVNINSPGGDVYEGIAIYNMLQQHKGAVEVRILGIAASISSIIAMAGDIVKIGKYGTFMIHDAWTFTYGNSRDLTEVAEKIEKTSAKLSNMYADKTGMTADECREYMQAGKVVDGSYFDGDEAVELGFCDSLLEPEKITEKETESNARRDIERALLSSGMTRSAARAAINEIQGKPDAALEVKPDADLPVTHDADESAKLATAMLNLNLAIN